MRNYISGRPDKANQRRWVESQLRVHGRYDVQTAIYRDGITRLAAIIKVLRDKGWLIETEDKDGKTAVYILKAFATIPTGTPVLFKGKQIGALTEPSLVHRAPMSPTYRCRVCGNPIDVQDALLSGDIVSGRCAMNPACRRAGTQSFKSLSS